MASTVSLASLASLATLTAGVFRPLLGASFHITLPDAQIVSATLAEVTEQAGHAPGLRAPFSLIFHHPFDPKASRPLQGTVRIENETCGAFEVFAVQLQPLGDTARWQVIFG